MKHFNSCTPQAASGTKLAASATVPRFGDKRDVGSLAGGMSVRWVDGQLQLGMPHMKYGTRRVRFDLEEVRQWLKEKYGQQRRGPIRSTDNSKEVTVR